MRWRSFTLRGLLVLLVACAMACGEEEPTPGSVWREFETRTLDLEAEMRVARTIRDLSLALADSTLEPIPLELDGEGAAQIRAAFGALADSVVRDSLLHADGQESRGPWSVTPRAPAPGGTEYRAWSIRLRRDSQVEISAGARESDLLLMIARGEPGALLPVAAWDASSGETGNPVVRANLPAGRYLVVLAAGRREGSAEGRVTVDVSTRTPILDRDTTFSDTLRLSDYPLGDSIGFRLLPLSGVEGELLDISMTSSQLDPALVLVHGRRFRDGAVVAMDDGAAADGGARIRARLPATGDYLLGMSAAVAGQAGPVELTVRRSRRAPASFDNSGPSAGRYALLVALDLAESDEGGWASADVGAMRDALVDRFGFDPRNVLVLTGRDLTRQRLANAVIQHLGQAGRSGLALLHVSLPNTEVPGRWSMSAALGPDSATIPGPAAASDGAPDDSTPALVLSAETVNGEDGASVLFPEELGYLLATLRAGRSLAIVDAGGSSPQAGDGSPSAKHVPFESLVVARTFVPPRHLLARDPGVAHELTSVELTLETIRSFRAGANGQGSTPVWWASAPGGPARSDASAGGGSVFTQTLAQQLQQADSTTAFTELLEGVGEGVLERLIGLGPGPHRPDFRGSAPAQTVEAFFGRR